MAFLISTTGTLSPVTIDDMAGISFTHPIVNHDLEVGFAQEEIRESKDLQVAIDSGYITAKDQYGVSISDVTRAVRHEGLGGLTSDTHLHYPLLRDTSDRVTVDSISATEGQILVYDSTSGDYVNRDQCCVTDSDPDDDHSYSGSTTILTAGENLSFGEVVYIKPDTKAWKADNDCKDELPAMYMALESIITDSTGSFLRMGIVRDDSWNWTPGDILYVDTTPGQMTQTMPEGSTKYAQSLGIAMKSNVVDFRPVPMLIQQQSGGDDD